MLNQLDLSVFSRELLEAFAEEQRRNRTHMTQIYHTGHGCTCSECAIDMETAVKKIQREKRFTIARVSSDQAAKPTTEEERREAAFMAPVVHYSSIGVDPEWLKIQTEVRNRPAMPPSAC